MQISVMPYETSIPRFQLKKTTESTTALSHLDIFITIQHGKYCTALYDKRDSFKFNIVNFPNMGSNIPSKPTYGVYISQLVRMGRICSSYHQFCERHYTLSKLLISQRFRYLELCTAFNEVCQESCRGIQQVWFQRADTHLQNLSASLVGVPSGHSTFSLYRRHKAQIPVQKSEITFSKT